MTVQHDRVEFVLGRGHVVPDPLKSSWKNYYDEVVVG